MAAIDNRTRHAHAMLNGTLSDPDKPFHSELGDIMYPGDPDADPANVYNCRCTLGSEIIGFKKKDGTTVLIETAENDIIMSDKQFGKKIGKHTKEYGLDPSNANDRHAMKLIINKILNDPDEVVSGEFIGQPDGVLFYIKGYDIVMTTRDNKFISIMKGGVNNENVKIARKR